MIQKVSDSTKMQWMNNDDSVKRESVSKSAVGSFSDIVVKRAKTLKAQGVSLEKIAKSFNMTEDALKGMIEASFEAASQQPTCDCMEKEASTNEVSEADKAQEAYEALRGKRAEAPSLKEATQLQHGKVSRGGSVGDSGGYHKSMGTDSKPTIFDSDKLERAVRESDNGERIRKENQAIESRREAAKKQYETISGENLQQALKETLQGKAAGVSSVAGTEAHKYSNKLPMNGMSIFDEKEFSRAKPTAGEKMVEAKNKEAAEKKADRSWTENGRKTVTTKDIAQSMIDSMLKSKE